MRARSFAFPLDGGPPEEVDESVAQDSLDDSNVAQLIFVDTGRYRMELVGSYERLTLEMTCGDESAILDVYRQLIVISGRYQ